MSRFEENMDCLNEKKEMTVNRRGLGSWVGTVGCRPTDRTTEPDEIFDSKFVWGDGGKKKEGRKEHFLLRRPFSFLFSFSASLFVELLVRNI